jgi:hypothetical protein
LGIIFSLFHEIHQAFHWKAPAAQNTHNVWMKRKDDRLRIADVGVERHPPSGGSWVDSGIGNHISAHTPVESCLYYQEVYDELSCRWLG